MATVIPFRALRPHPDKAGSVSSRSYDSEKERDRIIEILKENKESYLHIVKPHISAGDVDRIPDKHYPAARKVLVDMKEKGVLVKEETPCFYIHQIIEDIQGTKITYNGLVALTSVADYNSNRIKKHEATRTERLKSLTEHMAAVKAVGEPVLLTFADGSWFDAVVAKVTQTPPINTFSDERGHEHNVWVINQPELVTTVTKYFEKGGDLYIADGHHRMASAAVYCSEHQGKGDCYIDSSCNYILSYIIPAGQIKIYEFNRLVKDLGDMTPEDFISKLKNDFSVTLLGPAREGVEKKHHQFGMYIQNQWYGLDLKEGKKGDNVLENLDVSLLEKYILQPLLNIHDTKTDPRISFLDGTKGIERLQSLVDEGKYQLAFSLKPTSIQDVMAVADNNEVMPPKSTWFEPKLRTGLLIHEV